MDIVTELLQTLSRTNHSFLNKCINYDITLNSFLNSIPSEIACIHTFMELRVKDMKGITVVPLHLYLNNVGEV